MSLDGPTLRREAAVRLWVRQARLSFLNRFDPATLIILAIAVLSMLGVALLGYAGARMMGWPTLAPMQRLGDLRIIDNVEASAGCLRSSALQATSGRLFVARDHSQGCPARQGLRAEPHPQSGADVEVHELDPANRMWSTPTQPFADDAGDVRADGLSRACVAGPGGVACGAEKAVWALGAEGGLAVRTGKGWITWLSQRPWIRPDTGKAIEAREIAAAAASADGRLLAMATADGVVAVGDVPSGGWGKAIKTREGVTVRVTALAWAGTWIWLGANDGLYAAEAPTDASSALRFERISELPVESIAAVGRRAYVLSRTKCLQDASQSCIQVTGYANPTGGENLVSTLNRDTGLNEADVVAVAALGDDLLLGGPRGLMAYDAKARSWRRLGKDPIRQLEAAEGVAVACGDGWAGRMKPGATDMQPTALPEAKSGEACTAITFSGTTAYVATTGQTLYRLTDGAAELVFKPSVQQPAGRLAYVVGNGDHVLFVGEKSAVLLDAKRRAYREIELTGALARLPRAQRLAVSGDRVFAAVDTPAGSTVVSFPLDDPGKAEQRDTSRIVSLSPWGETGAAAVTADGSGVLLSAMGETELIGEAAAPPIDDKSLRDATVFGEEVLFATDQGLYGYVPAKRSWRRLLEGRFKSVAAAGQGQVMLATPQGTLSSLDAASKALRQLTGDGMTIAADKLEDVRVLSGRLVLAGRRGSGEGVVHVYDADTRRVVDTFTLGTVQRRIELLGSLTSAKQETLARIVWRDGDRFGIRDRLLPILREPVQTLEDAVLSRGALLLQERSVDGAHLVRSVELDSGKIACYLRQPRPVGAASGSVMRLDDRFAVTGTSAGIELFDRYFGRWLLAAPAPASAEVTVLGERIIWRAPEGNAVRFGSIKVADLAGYDTCAEITNARLGSNATAQRIALSASGSLLALDAQGRISRTDYSERGQETTLVAEAAPPPTAPIDPTQLLRAASASQKLVFVSHDRVWKYDLKSHSWETSALPMRIEDAAINPIGSGLELIVRAQGVQRLLVSAGAGMHEQSWAVAGDAAARAHRTKFLGAFQHKGLWVFQWEDGIEVLDPRTHRWLESPPAIPAAWRRAAAVGHWLLLEEPTNGRLVLYNFAEGVPMAAAELNAGRGAQFGLVERTGELIVLTRDGRLMDCRWNAQAANRTSFCLRIETGPIETGSELRIDGRETVIVSPATHTSTATGLEPVIVLPQLLSAEPLNVPWLRWDAADGQFHIKGPNEASHSVPPASLFDATGALTLISPLALARSMDGRTQVATPGGILSFAGTTFRLLDESVRFQPRPFTSRTIVAIQDGFVDGGRRVDFLGAAVDGASGTSVKIGQLTISGRVDSPGLVMETPVGKAASVLGPDGFAWDRREDVGWLGQDPVVKSAFGVHTPNAAGELLANPERVVWSKQSFAAARRPSDKAAASIGELSGPKGLGPDVFKEMALDETGVFGGDERAVSRLNLSPAAPVQRQEVLSGPHRLVSIAAAEGRRIVAMSGAGDRIWATDIGKFNEPHASADQVEIARLGPLHAVRNGARIDLRLGINDVVTGAAGTKSVGWSGEVFDFDAVSQIVATKSSGMIVATRAGVVRTEVASLPALAASAFWTAAGETGAPALWASAEGTSAAWSKACVTFDASGGREPCKGERRARRAEVSGFQAVVTGDQVALSLVREGGQQVPLKLERGRLSSDSLQVLGGCGSQYLAVMRDGVALIANSAPSSLGAMTPVSMSAGAAIPQLGCLDKRASEALGTTASLYAFGAGSPVRQVLIEPAALGLAAPITDAAVSKALEGREWQLADGLRLSVSGSPAKVTTMRREGSGWRALPGEGIAPWIDQPLTYWADGQRIWAASKGGIVELKGDGKQRRLDSTSILHEALFGGCEPASVRQLPAGTGIACAGGTALLVRSGGQAAEVLSRDSSVRNRELTIAGLKVKLVAPAVTFELSGGPIMLAAGQLESDDVRKLAVNLGSPGALHLATAAGWWVQSTASREAGRVKGAPSIAFAPAHATDMWSAAKGICVRTGPSEVWYFDKDFSGTRSDNCPEVLATTPIRRVQRVAGRLEFQLLQEEIPLAFDSFSGGRFQGDVAASPPTKMSDAPPTYCVPSALPGVALMGSVTHRQRAASSQSCAKQAGLMPSCLVTPIRRRDAPQGSDCALLRDGDTMTITKSEGRRLVCLRIEESSYEFAIDCEDGKREGSAVVHLSGRDLLEVVREGAWVIDLDRVR